MTAPQQLETYQEAAARQYFELFNSNDFTAIGALFAKDGQLVPPFDEAIVGPGAITTYLEKEAGSMTVFPEAYEVRLGENQCQVLGYVNAIAFKVGVEWMFCFSQAREISSLSIRLRASMGDLLKLRDLPR